MQLFTIGTQMLNQDGTLQVDSNNLPIPTYSQIHRHGIRARLHRLDLCAGRRANRWSGAPTSPATGRWCPTPPEHDPGSKQLLNGYVSPAGITPQQDLDNALANIFNHPNVGPFVGKQLIQHLVKSNPSPAYVSRVAAAFNDNGERRAWRYAGGHHRRYCSIPRRAPTTAAATTSRPTVICRSPPSSSPEWSALSAGR